MSTGTTPHRTLASLRTLALAAVTLALLLVAPAAWAATYYSQGGLAPNLTSSWNTVRAGGGSAPANFTAGDVFVIQNGHNMTTSATWSVSGTGSKVWIESGGTLTATSAITLAAATTFQIDANGMYVHDNASAFGSTIFQAGTKTFDAASTVVLNNSNTTGPSNTTFGNLTVNFTSDPGGAVNCAGLTTTINGNLTIQSTSTREFRLVANSPSGSTYTVAKDLIISGGIFNLSSGTATATLNIGGNLNQTGGTFTTAGVTTVAFTGGTNPTPTLTESGTLTNTNFLWQIAGGKTLALASNITLVGATRTMTVNGAFQLNQGAFPGNSGTWSYGAAGTLIFNNSSGPFGVNADNYWPAASGPTNVTVSGAGGITMNVARTVSGTFQTAAGVLNGNNLTLNGTAQINAGGFFTGSPVYGSSSTLVYNTPAGFSVGNEWTGSGAGAGGARTAGSGQPTNVTVNAGTLTLDSSPRALPGSLNLNGSLASGLTLTAGGDLALGGDLSAPGSSSFTHNNVGVWFIGGGTQYITLQPSKTLGYLILKNTGGSLKLATDLNVTGAAGDALQLLGTGSLDLNGKTLSLTGGGALKVDGAGRSILSSSSTGGLAFLANSSINNNGGAGSLILASSVQTRLNNAGVAFNSTTLNGILQVEFGGFVNTTPPTYGPASTLIYSNPAGFSVGAEWASGSTAGLGVPQNVTMQQGTTTLPASARTVPGNLSAGSPIALTSGGDLTVKGILTLSAPITTGAVSKLILPAGASIASNPGSYVDGNLQRNVPTGSNVALSFPVGSAGNPWPVDLNFASVGTAGDLVATTAQAGAPPAAGALPGGSGLSQSKYLNRYWRVTNSGVGFTTYDANFNFTPGELAGGANTANLLVAKNSGGTWSQPTVGTRTGFSTQATGLGSFSDFYLGEVATYTLTASAGANGSISPSGVTTVNSGGSQHYTITPAANYHVADVLVDGSSIGAVTSHDFTGVTADHTIAASFAIDTHTITASAGANGSISPNGVTAVDHGGSQHYTITASAGYHVADVLVDGVSVGAAGTYDFTGVTANHTIAASFAIDSYTLTASAGANGSISPGGVTSVNSGGSQHYTITAAANYHVADVLVDGSSVGAVTGYDFTNVTANHTIAASFAIDTHTITATAGADGAISPNGAVSVNHGANQSFSITPNSGFSIADVVVDGASQGVLSSYTFTNVTADHTISASFTAELSPAAIHAGSPSGTLSSTTSTLTVPVNISRSYANAIRVFHVTFQLSSELTLTGGTAGISEGGFLTSAGGTTSFQVVNNGGGSYTVDGAVLGLPCDVTALTGNLFNVAVSSSAAGGTGTLTVTASELRDCDNATLPSAAGTAASVAIDNQAPAVAVTAPNGGETWVVGTTHAITWTATDNVAVTTVDLAYSTDGGTTWPHPIASGLANSGSYAWTIPATVSGTAKVRATAHDAAGNAGSDASDADFTIGQWTVTATAGADGSIAPAGITGVDDGGGQTYTITAGAHHHIADVLVDGVSVGALGSYAFTAVHANHTIHATFAIDTWTITATAGADGSIAPAGATTLDDGADQTYTITPDAHHHVADVTVDGTSIGAVTTHTFTGVSANHSIHATFALDTYTLTATADAGGSIAPSGVTTAGYGTSQAYTITPDTGYHVLDVTVDGASIGAATSYTFSSVAANHTIHATFAIDTYTLTASADANGAIAPAGVTTVNHGGSQSYTITPDANYHVLDVTVDGSSIGAATSYTFSNVTANHTIHASFSLDTYTITATAGAHGSIAPAGATTVSHGGSQAYTITPDADYHVLDVTVDGTSIGAATSYTFSNVTAGHTIHTTFAIDTHTITASAGGNGAIAPNGAVVVDHGADQSFTITPDPGYHVADVTVDGGSVGAPTTYTFSNVTADHTLHATFAIDTYTITATAGANGSIAPAGATTVNHGSGQAYTITPDANYHVLDVTVDGSSVGAVTTYAFSNVTADHTIHATFALDTYSIAASADANGSIAPAGTTTVSHGGGQSYTITPDANYHVLDVTVDGSSVGAVTTYAFSNVTANHTIHATFALDTYTITATAGANGSIAPSGATTVNFGGSQSYTITPDANYHVLDVTVDGSSVGAVTTYAFSSVTANHTIHATFALDTYSIAASADANGSIAPAGTTTVSHGGSQSYTITPDANYHVLDVTVDGSSVGAVTTYAFSNVTANHTIHATFALDTYTITATAGANGSVAPSGATTVGFGGSQAYTITPDANHHVLDVTVDGSSVGAVTTYTFSSVSANHTLHATFALDTYTLTATAGANGSIAPSGATIVGFGGSQAYTITPDANYHVLDVTVDGSSVGAVTTYTFSSVSANHTIAASFALDTHVITASAGANGAIAPNGAVTVAHGADQSFTITPNSGYHVLDVTVDGSSVGSPASYTFTGVTADHTIAASFAANPPVAAITALAAAPVKSGNDTDGTTKITLSWPTLPAGQTVKVYRAPYGNYPEYDNAPNPGAVPVAPVYPPPAPWTLTSVTNSGTTDEPATRDQWYYVAFVTDVYGTVSPVSNRTSGVLDYFLGDVTDGATPGSGDNRVNTDDITALGAHYGISGEEVLPVDYLDVGPTTNRSVNARPTTDQRIDFEDLVMFAIDYGVVSAPQDAGHLIAAASTDQIKLEIPAAGADGRITTHLLMSGTGLVQGASIHLAWDPAVVRPVSFAQGEMIDLLGGVALSASPGVIDVARLGVRDRGLVGEGQLAAITFQRIGPGDPALAIASVDARDTGNQPVAVAASSIRLPEIPTVTSFDRVSPNPFRTDAALTFSLSKRGPVELSLYSVDGRRVRTLVSDTREPGVYSVRWDGRDDGGRATGAGVYYARLATGQGDFTRTLVYLR